MTDPGLTDLIAAHLTELIADAPEEDNYDAGYVAALADLRDSAAFKLVVEQHTNGRTAELEAELEKQKRGGRTIGKAIDRTLKWVIEASNSEDLIGDDGDGDWEIVWDRLFQLRPNLEAAIDRAEKAEATIARVEDAVSGLPACDKYQPDDTISCGWKNAVVEVRAALEGEQQ